MKRVCVSVVLLGLLLQSDGVLALSRSEQMAQMEERLEKLERLLQGQGLVEMQLQLQQLQQEVQSLRGQVEQLQHENEELRKQQRDLYQDLDRRLLSVERGGGQATTPAAGGDGGSVDTAEQDAYQKAFNLLKDLRYEEAVVAFGDYLQKYPKGRYAHLALYWRAESYYMQQKYKPALADYQNLVANYPDSAKKPEAMLKIGYCYNELKDYASARKNLDALIKAYPDSSEAAQAQKLLDKIKKQGK